jgi:hypothetical protein
MPLIAGNFIKEFRQPAAVKAAARVHTLALVNVPKLRNAAATDAVQRAAKRLRLTARAASTLPALPQPAVVDDAGGYSFASLCAARRG